MQMSRHQDTTSNSQSSSGDRRLKYGKSQWHPHSQIIKIQQQNIMRISCRIWRVESIHTSSRHQNQNHQPSMTILTPETTREGSSSSKIMICRDSRTCLAANRSRQLRTWCRVLVRCNYTMLLRRKMLNLNSAALVEFRPRKTHKSS